MCGRFSLTITEDQQFLEHFGIKDMPSGLKPRFNIAPSQDVAIIRNTEPDKLSFARWGLVPSWADDEKESFKMINARAENILQKPAYREPFMKNRCLVIADSFYEWQKHGSMKIPYRFMLKSKGLFAFAGVWDTWRKANIRVVSCSIITTDSNELVRKAHDRMPVILEDPKAYLTASVEDALRMLKPYPAEEMGSYRVSSKINSADNENPEVIQQAADQSLADFV